MLPAGAFVAVVGVVVTLPDSLALTAAGSLSLALRRTPVLVVSAAR